MTQQDQTGQGPAVARDPPSPGRDSSPAAGEWPAAGSGGPPGPGYPSPYLDAGGAVPQAYLAPPQPGQPRYAQPPPGYQPFSPPGSGPGGYGQPAGGYGPGAYGERGPAGSGRPGRSHPAARPGRDPALAAPWQRFAAACADWLLIVIVVTAIFIVPLLHLWRQLDAVTRSYPDLSSPGAQAAINAVAAEPASERTLLCYLIAIFAVALAYFWLQHAIWGATLAKRLLHMRVVTAADQSPISVRAAGIRAVATIAGPLLVMIFLSPVNLIGGVLLVADLGMPLVDPRVRALHDRVAGTIVVRSQWLARRPGSGPWQ